MSTSRSQGRRFFVIVHNDNDKHLTTHSDFLDGRFYATAATANSALANHIQSSPSRSASASSTSTYSSSGDEDDVLPAVATYPRLVTKTMTRDGRAKCKMPTGETFAVREICARSMCGGVTWWFVDGEEGNGHTT